MILNNEPSRLSLHLATKIKAVVGSILTSLSYSESLWACLHKEVHASYLIPLYYLPLRYRPPLVKVRRSRREWLIEVR